MNPNVLPAVLADILAACEAAYTQDGAPTVPQRTFVTHGQPAVEGEQLTVSAGWVGPMKPFPLAQQRAVKSSVVGGAQINVEVWRSCWPGPEGTNVNQRLPSPARLADAGLALAADATTLFGWISTLAANGGLCPTLPGISVAEDVGLGQMTPLGPSGLLAGWRWPITVKLSVLPR